MCSKKLYYERQVNGQRQHKIIMGWVYHSCHDKSSHLHRIENTDQTLPGIPYLSTTDTAVGSIHMEARGRALRTSCSAVRRNPGHQDGP